MRALRILAIKVVKAATLMSRAETWGVRAAKEAVVAVAVTPAVWAAPSILSAVGVTSASTSVEALSALAASLVASGAEFPLETVKVTGVILIAAVAGVAEIVTVPSVVGAVNAFVYVPSSLTVICPTTVGTEPALDGMEDGAPGSVDAPPDRANEAVACPANTT